MANERWQHRIVEIKPRWTGGPAIGNIQSELDRLGMQGWQLVTATQHSGRTHLYLKRPA